VGPEVSRPGVGGTADGVDGCETGGAFTGRAGAVQGEGVVDEQLGNDYTLVTLSEGKGCIGLGYMMEENVPLATGVHIMAK
jgi:hypothetical protein